MAPVNAGCHWVFLSSGKMISSFVRVFARIIASYNKKSEKFTISINFSRFLRKIKEDVVETKQSVFLLLDESY